MNNAVPDIDLPGRERRKTSAEDERDRWARENEFLVLSSGEAYERRVSDTGSIFIYQIDNGKWLMVYDNTRIDPKGNTWKSQNIKAGASKDGKSIYGVTWEKAAEEAIRFVKFMANSGKKRTEWK